jgi:Protein of unknown function (DUF1698)
VDLRDYIRTPADIAEAKALISQTHFTYQPFRIADELEVGGGYEFIRRKPGAGMVYWPTYDREVCDFPGYPLKIVDPRIKGEFTAANEALRRVYDGFVDQICEQVGDIHLMSVADIGCFNGYMPVSFARRGAGEAIGYDQDDRSGCFKFLNRILGTAAKFVHAGYDFATGIMPGCPRHDVVISMSVLQHSVEPFRHLHFLRSITRRALFLLTNVWTDEDYLIRYGEPNMIFKDAFPWCFDNSAYLSEPLLRKALEMAGFVQIKDLQIRLPASESQVETPGGHDYATGVGHAKSLTGRALLCFVDGVAQGPQADLRLGYPRSG